MQKIFHQKLFYTQFVAQETLRNIILLIFSSKKVEIGDQSSIITTNSNKNTTFALSISTFFDEKKIKNE